MYSFFPLHHPPPDFNQSENPVACYFRGLVERGELSQEDALAATLSFLLEDIDHLKFIIQTLESGFPLEGKRLFAGTPPEYTDEAPEAAIAVIRGSQEKFQQQADQSTGLYIAVYSEGNAIRSQAVTNRDDAWLVLNRKKKHTPEAPVGVVYATDRCFRLSVVVCESTTPAALETARHHLLRVANLNRTAKFEYVVLQNRAIDHTDRFLPLWLKEQLAQEPERWKGPFSS
ncbi:MAG: hypothetical protein K1Y36_26820 [Blastocatellia bacterium]|nr:hypothetical protein [Blastocatellia bacterium]